MQDKDGGYCPMCDTVWASPGKCKCNEIKNLTEDQIIARTIRVETKHDADIWNAAIEACFKEIAQRCPISQDAFEAVRKLKK